MNPLANRRQRPPSIMETERLLLRKPRIEDAATIFDRWVADEEVTRFMTWTPHKSIEETSTFIIRALKAWIEGQGEFVYIIEDRKTSEVMGSIGLRPAIMKAELGYCLARRYWNNGYMTEAVRGLIDWGLGSNRMQRIQALCDAENIGSARVMRKSGMTQEATLNRYLYCPNIDRKKLRTAKLYATTC